MILCYIAGKYTDTDQYKVKQNIYWADLLGMEVVRKFGKTGPGVMVMVPHTNTAHWEGVQDDEWFYEATEELLKRCDAMIYVPGDEERSRGTKQEIDFCVENGKPYFRGDVAGLKEFEHWLLLGSGGHAIG